MSIDSRTLARGIRRVVADVWSVVRWRLGVVIALALGAVLLEGLTVALVFPVLRELGVSESGEDNSITNGVDRLLDLIGVEPTLWSLVAVVLVASAVRGGLLMVHGSIVAATRYEYVNVRRERLFRRFVGARWSWFWTARTGTLTNLLLTETERMGGVYSQIVALAVGVSTAIVYAAVGFTASWSVSLIVIASGGALVLISRPVERRTYAASTEITARFGEATSVAEEVLNGAKFVKATATEEDATTRLMTIARRMAEVQTRAVRLTMWLTASFEVSAAVVLVCVIAVGARVLDVPAATVLVVSAVFGRIYPRLAAIQQARQTIATYLPSFDAIETAEMTAAAAAEPVDDRPLPEELRSPVPITVEDVTVRYGETVAIERVSMVIEPGTVVGIAGSSGSGKSSLVNALLRLVEIDGGRIGVGSSDVHELPLPAWRRAVGYVGQETVLFHLSVRENVTWGRSATDEELRHVLRLASAEEFVDAMPLGADSLVGDRGVLLSGGQRQRLGLARALLGNPSVLVLDEATSALDAEGERAVLDAVLALRGAVTIVMIAHRLATVRDADVVHVIEGGRLIESGTWNDLLASDSRLAALWRLQAETP